MAFFSMPLGYILYLDEPLALNIPLKVFFNLNQYWCLLFAIINKNFQQIAVYFLPESSEIDCRKGQPPLPHTPLHPSGCVLHKLMRKVSICRQV